MFKTLLICTCIVLSIPLGLMGQSNRPKASLQVNIGLPINLTNASFKGMMQGLINGSLHYQYTLKNSLSFGIGANYSYFDVNEFKVPVPVFGGMHSLAGFVKLGSEKLHSSNFGTDISIKAGVTQHLIGTNLNREQGFNPKQITSSYVEPKFGLILLTDEETAFRFNFSVGFYGFGFSPYVLGIQSPSGYDPNSFSKISTYLSVGFAYTHYFKMH